VFLIYKLVAPTYWGDGKQNIVAQLYLEYFVDILTKIFYNWCYRRAGAK